jgi:hypothetical protein
MVSVDEKVDVTANGAGFVADAAMQIRVSPLEFLEGISDSRGWDFEF